jgi:hypothetical protein
VTDLGLRGLFSSYLALELAPDATTCTGTVASGGGAVSLNCGSITTTRGVGIEQLIH